MLNEAFAYTFALDNKRKNTPFMKLTQVAIDAINTPRTRLKLALALNKSDDSVKRYISTNDVMLTTAAALKVIKSETGMSESKILESEPQPNA